MMQRVCYDYDQCDQNSHKLTPCQYPESCLYHLLSQPNHPRYALKVPHWSVDVTYSAASPIEVSFTLLGNSVKHYRLIARTLHDVANYLFPTSPTHLISLKSLYSVNQKSPEGIPRPPALLYPQPALPNSPSRAIVEDGFSLLQPPQPTATQDAQMYHSITLHVITPMWLERYKKPIHHPTFTDIIYFTLQRLKHVAELPHKTLFPLDITKAEAVHTTASALEQHNMIRQRTQKPSIKLQGFTGHIQFSPVPSNFIPYLHLASIVNLGKKTTHGLGCFYIESNPI